MKYNRLGKTNMEVSAVGLGTLTMSFSQKNLSYEEGANIIVHAVEKGINFIDTAEYYGNYEYIRQAFSTLKAKNLPIPKVSSKSLTGDYNGMKKAVKECLETLDIPCIDIFLLHEIRSIEEFNAKKEAWRALQECRTQGQVKAIGISTHHVDVTEAMANEDACDVVFSLINNAGLGIRKGNAFAPKEEMEEAIRKCADAGKGIYTMKALGGGNLVLDYMDCMNYASNVYGNNCVMLGFSSTEQVDKACEFVDGTLKPTYTPPVKDKRMKIDASDCEGCGSCMERCGSKAIFWGKNGLAEIDQSKCIRCGYCAPVCPVRAIIFL